MDLHPAGINKTQSVKSKYKKISEAPPKQKIKEIAPHMQRRTFGTIRDANVPEKKLPQKPKSKPSNQISSKQPKTESAKKTGQNESKDRKDDGFVKKKSPCKEKEGDGVVRTPLRPPFSAKPVRIPGTPYLSAEKCSSCRFDRLETSSYWLGQIKSAEAVDKHFVAAAFFRLARDCKAEPAKNLHTELKKYLKRHDYLSTLTEWEHVSGIYGILTNENETKSNEEVVKQSDSTPGDVQEQRE